MIRPILPALLLALAAAPAAAQTHPDSAALELGRRYTRWMYEGRADSLWAVFSPQMRQALGSAENLADMRAGIEAQIGRETAVVSEEVRRAGAATIYLRITRFSIAPVPVHVTVVTDAEGIVQGMLLRPEQAAAPSGFLEYRTKAPLRLPFEGEWTVVWGGRTVEQNYHAAVRNQRFAYDLLVTRDGRTHDGDGSRPEQYYCWGRAILAPAAAMVVTAVDGLPDQTPGRMDPAHPAGNHVILDHGEGEFSLLAHLRQGSVAVRAGERVAAGQKLGECGNSGNTSEPHLHYHLQNGPEFGKAEGLPAQFNGYFADGRRVERGEPVQGQVIRP
ncbi:MAG TPA: M23 family metallopeptidase [Longimicrobium sp.]|nr:M23 family metallopeptidase [Longimicrobium sp.]